MRRTEEQLRPGRCALGRGRRPSRAVGARRAGSETFKDRGPCSRRRLPALPVSEVKRGRGWVRPGESLLSGCGRLVQGAPARPSLPRALRGKSGTREPLAIHHSLALACSSGRQESPRGTVSPRCRQSASELDFLLSAAPTLPPNFNKTLL